MRIRKRCPPPPPPRPLSDPTFSSSAPLVEEASRELHPRNYNNNNTCVVDEPCNNSRNPPLVVRNQAVSDLPIASSAKQRSIKRGEAEQEKIQIRRSGTDQCCINKVPRVGRAAGEGEAEAPDNDGGYVSIYRTRKEEETRFNISSATSTTDPPSANACASGISVSSSSSLASHRGGWWFKGEITFQFPLKKRRRNLERNNKILVETPSATIIEEDQRQQDEDNSSSCSSGTTASQLVMKKKNKKINKGGKCSNADGGANLMEGSRCSRVNGRGWRCCQQTLVGYSLCEHHLGKGRLRSMTSVRSRRSIATGTATNDHIKPKNKEEEKEQSLLPSRLLINSWNVNKSIKRDNEDEDKEEEKALMKKNKKKIGMVKARSISSLLGQTNVTLQQHHHQILHAKNDGDDHVKNQQQRKPLQPPCDDHKHDDKQNVMV